MDESSANDIYSFAELNYLRLEAMDLFERCLTEGRSQPLEVFLEDQIARNPPRIDLLREVAEDLHQRLIALRESHFDLRDRVLQTLRDQFSLDLSPLIPLQSLDTYHLLNLDEAVGFIRQRVNLSSSDEHMLRKTLDASVDQAAQISCDVAMTEALYDYLTDWIMALNAPVVRRFWTDSQLNPPGDRIH